MTGFFASSMVRGCKKPVKIMKSGGGIKRLAFHGQHMIPIGLVNVEEF